MAGDGWGCRGQILGSSDPAALASDYTKQVAELRANVIEQLSEMRDEIENQLEPICEQAHSKMKYAPASLHLTRVVIFF